MNTIFHVTAPQEFSWKGKSFKQIYAAIKQNKNDHPNASVASFHHAQPLKLYRKELLGTPPCSEQRHATKIDALSRPQGTCATTAAAADHHLVVTVNEKDTLGVDACRNNPHGCTSDFQSIQDHAKKRVRSSGIVKPSYNANYKQYLERRSKTFAQNQYHFSRTVANQDASYTVAQGNQHASYIVVQGKAEPDTCEVRNTWKTSNRAFLQNGGQMSSAQTARLRTVADLVPDTPSKTVPKQFPIRTVPVFPKHADAMQRCQYTKT